MKILSDKTFFLHSSPSEQQQPAPTLPGPTEAVTPCPACLVNSAFMLLMPRWTTRDTSTDHRCPQTRWAPWSAAKGANWVVRWARDHQLVHWRRGAKSKLWMQEVEKEWWDVLVSTWTCLLTVAVWQVIAKQEGRSSSIVFFLLITVVALVDHIWTLKLQSITMYILTYKFLMCGTKISCLNM